ncbi:hypothetical protein [Streptomyces sp. B6B3]|jgi:hypothetical protein|uniref:hypothetical protein n=1 Tax=Streptomyces sp. B6B3 TaxID=3153570 RepID=UPI00325C962A
MVDAMDCELVTVPAREGLEAVDILRLRDGVGPVLHDPTGDTLGFVVPPGTAEAWDLPGSACTRARAARGGSGWLVAPDGAVTQTTEPALLRAALNEATRLLAVIDRCA